MMKALTSTLKYFFISLGLSFLTFILYKFKIWPFLDNDQQTMFIPFIFALIILFLTQYFINRRERKKIKAEKVEQIYLSSIDYVNSADLLITSLKLLKERDPYIMDNVALRQMSDSLRKIEMLCGLYFPNSGFIKDEYGMRYLPAVAKAFTKGIPPGYKSSDNLYELSRQHIVDAEAKLSKICIKLMKESSI